MSRTTQQQQEQAHAQAGTAPSWELGAASGEQKPKPPTCLGRTLGLLTKTANAGVCTIWLHRRAKMESAPWNGSAAGEGVIEGAAWHPHPDPASNSMSVQTAPRKEGRNHVHVSSGRKVGRNYGPCQANRHGPANALTLFCMPGRGGRVRGQSERAEISVIRRQLRVPCFTEMKGSTMLPAHWPASRVPTGPCPGPGEAALHDRDGRERQRNDQRACLDCSLCVASSPWPLHQRRRSRSRPRRRFCPSCQLGETEPGLPVPPILLPFPCLVLFDHTTDNRLHDQGFAGQMQINPHPQAQQWPPTAICTTHAIGGRDGCVWPQPLRLPACPLLSFSLSLARNSTPTVLSILRLSSLHHRSTSATDDATTPCRAKRRYIWPLSNIECTHPPRQTLSFPLLEAPKPPLVTSCWSPWFSCRVHTLATLVPASRRFGLDTWATSAADAGIALPSPSSPSRRPRCLPKPTLPLPSADNSHRALSLHRLCAHHQAARCFNPPSRGAPSTSTQPYALSTHSLPLSPPTDSPNHKRSFESHLCSRNHRSSAVISPPCFLPTVALVPFCQHKLRTPTRASAPLDPFKTRKPPR
ncbi:hypothetical protein COCMIDRAFT_27604 [Bipolaris oryzae ATCC 44560]|uniref:Uncharacterized protein n=1 Tax=Bipolaris oryzae ATCC 44560 TaxID=930090 RepID=W6Z1Y2_COCMI|nr:uncharacterized protein COCMIDRAFT_27604 [Bipolaris oryzae ATCC 44560]EUC43995.1 hypothetical protein COCMIDRAFT_27604 [Bipolaris oryzae ATCC 44560]